MIKLGPVDWHLDLERMIMEYYVESCGCFILIGMEYL